MYLICVIQTDEKCESRERDINVNKLLKYND